MGSGAHRAELSKTRTGVLCGGRQTAAASSTPEPSRPALCTAADFQDAEPQSNAAWFGDPCVWLRTLGSLTSKRSKEWQQPLRSPRDWRQPRPRVSKPAIAFGPMTAESGSGRASALAQPALCTSTECSHPSHGHVPVGPAAAAAAAAAAWQAAATGRQATARQATAGEAARQASAAHTALQSAHHGPHGQLGRHQTPHFHLHDSIRSHRQSSLWHHAATSQPLPPSHSPAHSPTPSPASSSTSPAARSSLHMLQPHLLRDDPLTAQGHDAQPFVTTDMDTALQPAPAPTEPTDIDGAVQQTPTATSNGSSVLACCCCGRCGRACDNDWPMCTASL
ncbi:hypothetical protein BC831DRAFT_11079 [Entophlyctis helioformis]|nr:hypothetical protein BC831DRAFT_11079 [Entophlyctis helioformis]